MNIGTLTATLGIDSSAATASMTAFQRQMLTAVNKVNATLSTLSASMLKVAGSAEVMGASSVAGINKIVVASKMASVSAGDFATKISLANAAGARTAGLASSLNTTAATATAAATTMTNAGKATTGAARVTTQAAVTGATAVATAGKTASLSMASVTKSLAAVNSGLQRFGYLATTAFTLPIVMIGTATFKMAKDFEFNIQKMVGLIGLAQKSATDFGDQILKLGPAVGKGPRELSDAMYYIVSAGIRGSEAMDVLRVSAMAASSGLGETKDVAQLVTSALNAYKNTGLTAAKATDILVAAVRVGKIEAEGFANAVGSVIPIASNMGVSLDQVTGAMAAMSLQGSTAAQSATYLKGMLNNLAKGSEIGKGAEALKSIGTSYAELRDILKDQGIIVMLDRVRKGMEKYGDTLVAKVFPNIRAMTGVLSIAGKNFEYNSTIMKEVTNSAGSLGKAFAAVSDTIKLRYDKALSSIQSSSVSFGKVIAEGMLPILEKLGKKVSEIAESWGSLSEKQKENRIAMAAYLAILGPVSLLVSGFVWIIRGLISAVEIATVRFAQLRVAMLANPYVAVAALIAAVVGGIVHFTKKTLEANRANSEFNKALVMVGGSLKQLKELSQIDFKMMSPDELINAREMVKAQWEIAKAKLAQAEINLSEIPKWMQFLGLDRGNNKFANEQMAIIQKLKSTYSELWTTIIQGSLESEKAKNDMVKNDVTSGLTSAIDEQKQALEELNLAWAQYGNLIGMASKAGKNWWMVAKDKDKNDLLNTRIPDRFNFGRNRWDVQIDKNDPLKNMGYTTLTTPSSMPGLSSQGSGTQLATIESVTNGLLKQTEVITVLSRAFEELFTNGKDGFKAMIEQFLQGINKLAAELLAKVIIWKFLDLISTGGAGTLIDFIKSSLGIKKVQQYAGGTNYAQGGLSLVGERGPELVNLPRGSKVYPNGMLGAGRQSIDFAPVELVIKENSLTGILKKANNRKSLY